MKHFFILIATALLGLASASCSDDDKLSTLPEAVPVVKAETFFKVTGGEHTVTLATAPAQAYALDSWLEVSKSDKVVTLKAGLNTDAQSRNTLLVLKNAAGDSTTLNIMQEGINFGLPQDAAYYGGDEAYTTQFSATSNVEVTYTSTADWLTLTRQGSELHVALTANTTKHPRVAFVKAVAEGKTDSLIFVQASLADVAGNYEQHALQLNSDGQLVPVTSQVRITRINNTKARFTIDNHYNWEIDFKPGHGFTMSNGKVLREETDATGTKFYLESLLAVDSYTKAAQTVLIGEGDLLDLRVANDGSLQFMQHAKLDETRNWASYAIGRSTSRKLDQGSWRGIVTEFIQPRLVRK